MVVWYFQKMKGFCAHRMVTKMKIRTEDDKHKYPFLDEAHLLDVDPQTLSLESLYQFKAALMHKLIYVNAEDQRRSKILAETTKEMPSWQKAHSLFADALARTSALNAALIQELEHMLKS